MAGQGRLISPFTFSSISHAFSHLLQSLFRLVGCSLETQTAAHSFNIFYAGQSLATFEGTVGEPFCKTQPSGSESDTTASSVMAAIFKDYEISFAPGYLENVEMVDCEQTPRYADSLTLPMQAPLLVTARHRKR